VHKLSGITDGAAGGGNLDGVAACRWDGEAGSSTLVPGRESTLGILGAGILGSRIDCEVGILEASHDEGIENGGEEVEGWMNFYLGSHWIQDSGKN
jgi:hypothetical protein